MKIGKVKKSVYIVTGRIMDEEDSLTGFQFSSGQMAEDFAEKSRKAMAKIYRDLTETDETATELAISLDVIQQPVDDEGEPDGEPSFAARLEGGEYAPVTRNVNGRNGKKKEKDTEEEDEE